MKRWNLGPGEEIVRMFACPEDAVEVAHTLSQAKPVMNHLQAGSVDWREADWKQPMPVGLSSRQQAVCPQLKCNSIITCLRPPVAGTYTVYSYLLILSYQGMSRVYLVCLGLSWRKIISSEEVWIGENSGLRRVFPGPSWFGWEYWLQFVQGPVGVQASPGRCG